MAVYFKFKSAKDFESVSFDGHFISVASLKEQIVAKKKLAGGSDFDIVILNAQSNEEYTDEAFLVPKSTSVVVRRFPRPSVPIVVRDEHRSSIDIKPVDHSGLQTSESPPQDTLQPSILDELDCCGVHPYAAQKVVQARSLSLAGNEDDRLKGVVVASAIEWQRQIEEASEQKGYYRNKWIRSALPVRGTYGRAFAMKVPSPGYVCHRCGVVGHFIQDCPTNCDPAYDKKKVRPATGIPRTMLEVDADGTYVLSTGQAVVLKPNEAAFEREIEFLPSKARQVVKIPPELCCPLCKQVLKDATLTSKCCFKSYCDKCVRNEIISKGKCFCGATNILVDDLLPNKALRDAIEGLLESSQVSSITNSDNAGNRGHVPDMGSARSKVSISLSRVSSVGVESAGSDTYEPAAEREQTVQNDSPGSVNQGMEAVDGSVKFQLTKDEPMQEMVSSVRSARPETGRQDKGISRTELSKGKKNPKAKGVRQVDTEHSESMFGQGPSHNNVENYCMHCGSYEHPSGDCLRMNRPGYFRHPVATQELIGPGFSPQMMHQPMGGGYRTPYHENHGPYNVYGLSPYEFRFNGPMFPPQEPVAFQVGMMPNEPRIHMQWDRFDQFHPHLTNRREFKARDPPLKRKREREQHFCTEERNVYDSHRMMVI